MRTRELEKTWLSMGGIKEHGRPSGCFVCCRTLISEVFANLKKQTNWAFLLLVSLILNSNPDWCLININFLC